MLTLVHLWYTSFPLSTKVKDRHPLQIWSNHIFPILLLVVFIIVILLYFYITAVVLRHQRNTKKDIITASRVVHNNQIPNIIKYQKIICCNWARAKLYISHSLFIYCSGIGSRCYQLDIQSAYNFQIWYDEIMPFTQLEM